MKELQVLLSKLGLISPVIVLGFPAHPPSLNNAACKLLNVSPPHIGQEYYSARVLIRLNSSSKTTSMPEGVSIKVFYIRYPLPILVLQG
jgi:hypothetical protein